MASKIMTPKVVQVLYPRNDECVVILCITQSGFADVAQLRILRWKNDPGSLEWTLYNHRCSSK